MKYDILKSLRNFFGYLLIFILFSIAMVIILGSPIVNAQIENLTITSDTQYINTGVNTDVTFSVTRACGSESSDVCTQQYPPSQIGAKDVIVTLSGSAEGSGTTDSNGKVTIPINATEIGAVTATASKEGFSDASLSIPVLSEDITLPPTGNYTLPDFNNTFPNDTYPNETTPTPTPTPTLTPTSTPTLTPTPTSNNTCTTEEVDMGTQSSYAGNSYNFGLDFSSTKVSWNITWYVNGSIVASEINITGISKIAPVGKVGSTNVSAHTINNNCRVVNYNWIWTVTQKPAPSSNSGGGSSGGSSSGGSSSGGGGGSGGSSPESFYNIEKSMTKDNDLVTGKYVPYTIQTPGFIIYQIDIMGTSNEPDVTLKIEHLKNISSTVDKLPAGIILGYENIWIFTKRLEAVDVDFKVSNTWLSKNGLNKEDVKLLSYDGNWWKLRTNVTTSDGIYTYYKAIAPGSSVYAISGLKPVQLSGIPNATLSSPSFGNNASPQNINTNHSSENTSTSKVDNTTPMIGAATIIILILGAFLIVKKGYSTLKMSRNKK